MLPLLLLSALLLSFSSSLAVVFVVAGRGPLPSGSVTRGEAGSTGSSDPGLVCDMAVGCSDVEVVNSSGFVPYSYTLNLSGIRPADFSCNRSGTLIFCMEQSVVEKRTLAFRPFAVMAFSGKVMHRESVEGRRKTKQRNIKSFFGKIHLCKVELILLSFLFFNVLYSVIMRWQFFLLSVFLMTMSSLSCKRYYVFCLLLHSVFS